MLETRHCAREIGSCPPPPEVLNKKRFGRLKRHGQETGRAPGIYPLAKGMPIRSAENIDLGRQLFRGRKGFIHGWTLSPDCGSEFALDALPLASCARFPDAEWRVGKLAPACAR